MTQKQNWGKLKYMFHQQRVKPAPASCFSFLTFDLLTLFSISWLKSNVLRMLFRPFIPAAEIVAHTANDKSQRLAHRYSILINIHFYWPLIALNLTFLLRQ